MGEFLHEVYSFGVGLVAASSVIPNSDEEFHRFVILQFQRVRLDRELGLGEGIDA